MYKNTLRKLFIAISWTFIITTPFFYGMDEKDDSDKAIIPNKRKIETIDIENSYNKRKITTTGTENKHTFIEQAGCLYQKGQGVLSGCATAMEWHLKAAEKGNAIAITNIGCLYHNGQGVSQDYAKALEWHLKAAEKGDVIAMRNIGLFYQKGQGVSQDYAKALEWL